MKPIKYNIQDYDNAIDMVMKHNRFIAKDRNFVTNILNNLLEMIKKHEELNSCASGGFILLRESDEDADEIRISVSMTCMRDINIDSWVEL